MKYLLTVLLVSFSSIDPTEIAKVNELKEEAQKAYLAGNFEKSVEKYSYLLDTMNIEDESATLNLAHAYYQLKNNDYAIKNYQKLQDAEDESLRSLAYQQLGVLSNDPKTLAEALSYFKEAIKSDPTNDDARYNYELLKKKLKEQQQNQDQNQDQENKDQENKDQEEEKKDQQNQDQKDQKGENQEQQKQEGGNQENKDQEQQKNQENQEGEESEEQKQQQQQENKEGEESEEEKQQQRQGEEQDQNEEENKGSKNQPPSTAQKLKEMNISEEKAKMILEALKNNEIQYIQQNRRKATKRKDKDKPDW